MIKCKAVWKKTKKEHEVKTIYIEEEMLVFDLPCADKNHDESALISFDELESITFICDGNEMTFEFSEEK